jgi:crotonobetainyl-CoA:carnitine CoA-transferase CaiB-like acyl-CoA transferase
LSHDQEFVDLLGGLAVVEVGTGVGSAYACRLLALLGADVTKLVVAGEQSGEGDDHAAAARRAYLDAGKRRRIVADAAQADRLLLELAAGCDAVVRGTPDAALVGDEPQRLRAVNPRLAHTTCSPFGVTGPAAGWSGSDLAAQALGGWCSLIGNPDEAPLSMSHDMGAMTLGVNAAAATLTALLAAERDGEAHTADVAEADVLGSYMRTYSTGYRFYDIPLRRAGHRAPGNSGRYPHVMLPCRDGHVVLICRAGGEWDRLVEMIGSPAWASQERYRDFYAMALQYPDEVDALLAPWLLDRTKEELRELATRYRVPMAPVRSADEVLGDEQLAFRDFFVEVAGPDGEALRVPGLPARFLDAPEVTA